MNMRIILREKVTKLGNIGDQVLVKPGYARNFLFPYGKAVPATPQHIATFERHRVELEQLAAEQLEKSKLMAKKLEGKTFRILAKARNEGKLFGSIGLREIAEVISRECVSIEKQEVNLPNGPIRQIGKYEILIRLHTNVSVTVIIEVLAE